MTCLEPDLCTKCEKNPQHPDDIICEECRHEHVVLIEEEMKRIKTAAKYAGKWVAWNDDHTKILAAHKDMAEVEKLAKAQVGDAYWLDSVPEDEPKECSCYCHTVKENTAGSGCIHCNGYETYSGTKELTCDICNTKYIKGCTCPECHSGGKDRRDEV